MLNGKMRKEMDRTKETLQVDKSAAMDTLNSRPITTHIPSPRNFLSTAGANFPYGRGT